MTQYCGLCDNPLPRSQKVHAQISESMGAYVHRSCAELLGLEYEGAARELPPIDEQIDILTEGRPTDGDGVLTIQIQAEEMGNGLVYVAEPPAGSSSTVFADSIHGLFEKLAYQIDWALTEDEEIAEE